MCTPFAIDAISAPEATNMLGYTIDHKTNNLAFLFTNSSIIAGDFATFLLQLLIPITEFSSSFLSHTFIKKVANSPAIMEELVKEKARLVTLWSIVYPGMLVASGELIATIAKGVHNWDIAALKIIVEEAGGKVTSLTGEEQRYDEEIKGALITNSHVHDKILKIIKDNLTNNKS